MRVLPGQNNVGVVLVVVEFGGGRVEGNHVLFFFRHVLVDKELEEEARNE
jgi:hypothetical protein